MDRIQTILTPGVFTTFRNVVRTLQRRSVRKKLRGQNRLHLGCGANILDGWANLDLQGNGSVIGFDLTNRLPIDSNTIELIYSEHFIEHLTLNQTTALLAECHRVLQSGGIIRLSTPSLKKIIDEYLVGRTSEWLDVDWTPGTPCQMVNEGLRLWGHQFVFDADELRRTLEDAGFRRVIETTWRESATPALRGLESRPFHGEIIFEAVK
ncbi:MAG: methyltransferase domain-containing protein [Pyrinomonadaceae bacterium]